MTTYEYKFVKLKISMWTGKPKQSHHEIVEEHARQGWRFVQYLPPMHGHYEAELAFERPIPFGS
jgi:hypothetical protein